MILSKRLQVVADRVPMGGRVIDVGTDHGHIPVWLIQNGICESVIAADINQGPLDRARNTARRYGCDDRLSFLLCDGLSGCDEKDVDTVIIAGMGGETIMGILSATPWALEKTLILQPQSKTEELRKWLSSRKMTVYDAALVEDAGRIYVVWLTASGEEQPLSPVELLVDRMLVKNGDPLLVKYVEQQIKLIEKRIRGLEASKNDAREEIDACLETVSELRKIVKETEINGSC